MRARAPVAALRAGRFAGEAFPPRAATLRCVAVTPSSAWQIQLTYISTDLACQPLHGKHICVRHLAKNLYSTIITIIQLIAPYITAAVLGITML